MALHFTASKATFSYLEATRGYLEKSLTVQNDRVIYLFEDTLANLHRHIDVWEYPNGRIEVRADGTALPWLMTMTMREVPETCNTQRAATPYFPSKIWQ